MDTVVQRNMDTGTVDEENRFSGFNERLREDREPAVIEMQRFLDEGGSIYEDEFVSNIREHYGDRQVAFVDVDGTLIKKNREPEKEEWILGAREALELLRKEGIPIIIWTQGSRDAFTEKNEKMTESRGEILQYADMVIAGENYDIKRIKQAQEVQQSLLPRLPKLQNIIEAEIELAEKCPWFQEYLKRFQDFGFAPNAELPSGEKRPWLLLPNTLLLDDSFPGSSNNPYTMFQIKGEDGFPTFPQDMNDQYTRSSGKILQVQEGDARVLFVRAGDGRRSSLYENLQDAVTTQVLTFL